MLAEVVTRVPAVTLFVDEWCKRRYASDYFREHHRPFDCIAALEPHQPEFCFVVHPARNTTSSTPSRTLTPRYLAMWLICFSPGRHFRMVSDVFTPFLRRQAECFAQGSEVGLQEQLPDLR